MQSVFVEHIDTPASQAVANQLAKMGKYNVAASLYDYSDVCFEITTERIDESISVFTEDDLFSDVFVEYLLQTDIFILTPFDINLTLKLLQLIQQSCRSVRVVLLAPHLTLSRECQEDPPEPLNLEAPCLPVYNAQQYLIKKIDGLVRRIYTTDRRISGQIVFYGMIYNSFARSLNPFAELCSCVKMTHLYPHFANTAFEVPMTHAGRVAEYITRFDNRSAVIVDVLISYKQLCQCLQNGAFGSSIEVPDELLEQTKPKTPAKGQIPREIPHPKLNLPLIEISVSASDYSTSKTFTEVIEKLKLEEKREFEIKQAEFLLECADKQPIDPSPKSPTRAKGVKSIDCTPEAPVFKSNYELSPNPLHSLSIKDVVSLYTYQCLLHTTPIKLPEMDDFSVESFKAFLSYEESADPVINTVEGILLSEMVTEIPEITRTPLLLIELYAYRQLSNKDIFLTGCQHLNDLDRKLALFKGSPCYKFVSPSEALRFIFTLGENCKNEEFWEGYLPTSGVDRVESATKGKRGEQTVLRNTDFIAFVCRLLLSKSVSADSRDVFTDTIFQSFSGEEDAYLLAFAVSLYLQYTNKAVSLVYYGFDVTDTTVASFKLLKQHNFEHILGHFVSPEFAEYEDVKKIPEPQKGMIALNEATPKAKADEEPVTRENVELYWQHSEFVNNVKPRNMSLNPLLSEIIMNGGDSSLTVRKETYVYYKILADIIREELSIDGCCCSQNAEFTVNITGLFSTLRSSIPSIPCAFDVSALFVPKHELQVAYLMHYNAEKEDSAMEPVLDSGKKTAKDKTVVELTENEINRNYAIEEAMDFDVSRIYRLLEIMGDCNYVKLLEERPNKEIETLEQLWSLFGRAGFELSLIENGLVQRRSLIMQEAKQISSNSSEASVKSKVSDAPKPESELKTEKSKVKNGISSQVSEENVIEPQEEVALRQPREAPLFSQELSILKQESELLASKLQEAELYYDQLAKQEAEQERQAKLKLQGIGEHNFDNNSFGDLAEHSDENKVGFDVASSQANRTPRRMEEKTSQKSSPKVSGQNSPKSAAGSKKTAGAKSMKEEKRAVDDEELKLQQAQKAEAELQASQEKERKIEYYEELQSAVEFLSETHIKDDLAQALAALILAVESGLIGPGEHVAFLGEELLEISQEKRTKDSVSNSPEISQIEANDFIEDEDPTLAEMESCAQTEQHYVE